MTKLLFIEGVSGVGKSTLARKLNTALTACGYKSECYLEFDFRNPIDFYCAAYYNLTDYAALLRKYRDCEPEIIKYTVPAGASKLVRYYDGDTPLFPEPLLGELCEREFCYNPKNPVPIEKYTETYEAVWRNFAEGIADSPDFIIFDGSLIHHPVNDMMRNYGVSAERAASHVKKLLDALGTAGRQIIYLESDNIPDFLRAAHLDRGQAVPSEEEIAFWERRYENDLAVISALGEDCRIYNISETDREAALQDILKKVMPDKGA